MYIFTITKWKRKLAAVIISVCFLIGLGFGLNWHLSSEDDPTNIPTGDLQNDVMSKPIEVQGPAQAKEENKGEEQEKGKEVDEEDEDNDEDDEEKEDKNTENSEDNGKDAN